MASHQKHMLYTGYATEAEAAAHAKGGARMFPGVEWVVVKIPAVPGYFAVQRESLDIERRRFPNGPTFKVVYSHTYRKVPLPPGRSRRRAPSTHATAARRARRR